MNVYQLFRSHFATSMDRAFMDGPGFPSFTYAEFDQAVAGLSAALLGLGLRRSDRVLVSMDKSPWLVVAYFACLRAGLVFVPVNVHAPAAELRRLAADAEPALLVEEHDAEDVLTGTVPRQTLTAWGRGSLARLAEAAPAVPIADVGPEDMAAIIYTSGSTGLPKGVSWSHGLMCANARMQFEQWGFGREDAFLHAMPLFHSHGLSVGFNSTLMAGGRVRLLGRFQPDEVLTQLSHCTVFSGVPTMYVRLLESTLLTREACRKIRLFLSGSAGLPEAVGSAFEARTGHRILEFYGTTETGTIASHPLQGVRVSGSVGRILPGVQVKVVAADGGELPSGKVGELRVRKQEVLSGYWRQPKETTSHYAEGGFFCTGDLATIDKEGYLRLVGRTRDVIVSGGFKIYPREIEVALDRQPGVRQSVVFGVPHPSLGEAPIAMVVMAQPPAQPEEALLRGLRVELPAHKLPRHIVLTDDIPRSPTGKVDVKGLRQQYRQLFTTSAT